MELEESEVLNEALISFLEKTELGTNGARYSHLDVRKRILDIDQPQSFTLKRQQRIVANVTFCVRDFSRYVRYFAFNSIFQSTAQSNRKSTSKTILELKILKIFKELEAKKNIPFYAYIEADNKRSLMMSERFNFHIYTHIISRTFSRVAPKKNKNISFSNDWEAISNLVYAHYGHYDSYFDTHVQKPPFVTLRDGSGEIKAYARFTKVTWRLHRLPGIFGGALVRVLPYIPILNKLIQPKKHSFLTPDIVSHTASVEQLQELFVGALALYDVKSLIWFVDPNDPLYQITSSGFSWGILDKIIGIKKINVVKRNTSNKYSSEKPFFVSSLDLI